MDVLYPADELAKELQARRRRVVYDTVRIYISGCSRHLGGAEGQRRLAGKRRSSETSTGLEKDKPLDERLEDELWVLMAAMGFSRMSSGRIFKANLDGTLRQLDSVAVDDESVVVVECTQAGERTSKSMRALVEKVASWRNSQASLLSI